MVSGHAKSKPSLHGNPDYVFAGLNHGWLKGQTKLALASAPPLRLCGGKFLTAEARRRKGGAENKEYFTNLSLPRTL